MLVSELCNVLNRDLIHLLAYSPKYNPIEQVWRTMKATISRKYISSILPLKYLFLTEFKKVVDKPSYWKIGSKIFIIFSLGDYIYFKPIFWFGKYSNH